MATIRAALFDLDGVLVDVSGSYRLAITATAAHFTGIPVDDAAVQRLKDSGGYNDDWRVTAELIARTGTRVAFADVVREFNLRYRGPNWDGLIAAEPALVTARQLDALRDRFGSLGLVTGRPLEEARFTLDRFGWTDRFDVLVAMEDAVGRGKPDPRPLQIAFERLASLGRAVDPDEAVYVGDSVDDMTAARAAGCRAIGFVPPYLDAGRHASLLRDRGAHAVIVDHDALADAVSSLPD